MGSRIQACLLVISIQILVATAATNVQDLAALMALKNTWTNTPPNWVTSDPCDNKWDGIHCSNSRVIIIKLASMNLTGGLSGDIQQLSELHILDLSYNTGLTGPLPSSIGNLKKLSSLILIGCGFNGLLPDTIGSLQQLLFLSLNSNKFIGPIPPSIGNLSNLYWLDLADNKLSGSIPISSGNTPGLDMLVNAKHFHLGNNELSGEIPSQLFNSKLTLKHLLLESNQLNGSIPLTLGLVQTLEVLRLDRSSLTGPVPSNFNNLTNVNELHLSNNQLTGPSPNLTGMNVLNYVDMSNNTFDVSDFPPWFSTLLSLSTLVMENTRIQGQIPIGLFSLPGLQTLVLRTNHLNGTLDVGSSNSNQLQLIDLQNNSITGFTVRGGLDMEIILTGNPVCMGSEVTRPYCSITPPSNPSYSTPPKNCVPVTCSSGQSSSPNCRCQYPYTGTLFFRATSLISDLGNSSIYTSLESSLMRFFGSDQLPVDSVSLSNPYINTIEYFVLSLEVFPSGQSSFNRTGISEIGFVLSNQTFKPPHNFGPFFFIGDPYSNFAGIECLCKCEMNTRDSGEDAGSNKSSNTGIIIGAVVGCSVLVLLALLAGVYAFRQKRRTERADKVNNPFASWDPNKSSGDIPQLKGARCFSFEELKKCTNNFSEANSIGSGGYGKVYRGMLSTGKLIAIKRAQRGSMQGGLEFKTEIELLSRVHHTNLVSLVGFCFEQGEQMLVYEHVPNGTLRENLSGKTGIRLDWMRRLRIALGAARGLQYLHELANPPIIHRDIKSNNILLDEHLNAKVADFGLSKPMGDTNMSHVTTQVKGTMGYVDPEYYMTQQLTEKSDVYSYGVVMLELITARQPIKKGKYIVREVRQRIDKAKVLYDLHEILDPAILGTTPRGLEKFVDLTMKCVEDDGSERPTMGEVVKEIENIMQIAGLNPNADSASTSASYEGRSKGCNHPDSDDSLFLYSGTLTNCKARVPVRLLI